MDKPYVFIPMLQDRRYRDERRDMQFDLFIEARIVFLGQDVDDGIANNLVLQLLYLDREDPDKDIHMYINSRGGSVTAGLAIYDTMQLIRAPVSTYAVGTTASMGTILLTAGTKGKRFALPNATIHLHQVIGGAYGQASDVEIQVREILRTRELLNGILKKHTGLSDDDIVRYTDRDFFMTPEKAKELGVIDDVLYPVPQDGEKK